MKTKKDIVADKTRKLLDEKNFGNLKDLNRAAVVNQIGGEFSGGGLRDIDKADSADNKVDADTMFAEGSIGKARYAGLAYMMEQDERQFFGAQGLQRNAKEFFSQPEVGKFLEKHYPGKNLQNAIDNLFTDGSEQATLADLTTHRSGIGDTTLDGLAMLKTKGLEHPFTLPDLLLPQAESVVPRDKVTQKPQARKGLKGDPSRAIYGEHEYSNLGYNILATAMEAAYSISTGQEKNYQQLTEDFMLHPSEGRAKDFGLSFDRTKFPKDLEGDSNVIQAKWMEKDKDGNDVVANANKVSSAGAAGGIFASAKDSKEFFSEFFKGFPGTKKEVNPFFTEETIQKMAAEAEKHNEHGGYSNQPTINQRKQELQDWEKADEAKRGDRPVIPNPEWQFPGVNANINERGEIASYAKTGGTPGYTSRLEFDTETGDVSISMRNEESITSQREKLAALESHRQSAAVAESAGEISSGFGEERASAAAASAADDVRESAQSSSDHQLGNISDGASFGDSPAAGAEASSFDPSQAANIPEVAGIVQALQGAGVEAKPSNKSEEFNLANGGRQIVNQTSLTRGDGGGGRS